MEPLFADEKRRMYEFKTLMEPVLHLSPYCLTESLCDEIGRASCRERVSINV